MQSELLPLGHQLSILKVRLAINELRYDPQRQGQTNHFHSCFELYCNSAGTSLLRLDFSNEITVDKGEWVLLRPRQLHEELVYGRCSGYTLGIESDPLGGSLFERALQDGYVKGVNGRIADLLSEVARQCREHPVGYAEYISHLLSILMLELCRACGARSNDRIRAAKTPENVGQIIDSFFNRVFRSEKEGLSIANLASELHLSTRQCSRILQKYYGMSFGKLLLVTRLRFTECLLLQTERPISEICELCGLSEPYLVRSFKEVYGLTPAQYRMLHKKDLPPE